MRRFAQDAKKLKTESSGFDIKKAGENTRLSPALNQLSVLS